MGINYLWDTNTIIYYLQQQFSAKAEKYIDNLLKDEQPVISAITEIELLCWKSATSKDINVINNFIADAFVIEIEQPIKIKDAEIRKNSGVKLADAIIAATAIIYNLTLLTRNIDDFKKVRNIKITNPWEM